MRNKGLNNNLTGSISKGGVLYRPGENPVLTKEQLAQANLVSKLPHDFPLRKLGRNEHEAAASADEVQRT